MTDITPKIKIDIRKKVTIQRRQNTSDIATDMEIGVWQRSSPSPSPSPSGITISFDVGIVNLAYCVMSESPERNVKIYDWNIIKLVDGNPKLMCGSTIRSSHTKCTQKAHYIDGGVGYCKRHGNSSMRRNITSATATEIDIKTALFRHLDSDPIFLGVDNVVVELQLLKAREIIKSIGHAIFDYYVIRGTIDNHRTYGDMKFIDARNKLTMYGGPPLSCHLKTPTARNKWYSIRYCEWVLASGKLKDGKGLAAYFGDYAKKDDLADCLLQGLWYLKDRHPVTEVHKQPLSEHQMLIYRENNVIKYNKCKPRRPNPKHNKYSLAGIKYLIAHQKGGLSPQMESSIVFFFGDVEYFNNMLKNM